MLPIKAIGDYEFLKQIGKGTTATRYKVLNKKYNRYMVAKVINLTENLQLSRLALAKTQIDILSQLDHPNIIRIYDKILDSQNYFLFFEECSNENLSDVIKNRSNLTLNRIWAISYQILLAVDYCHSKQIAHRDIKPSSVLFDCNNKPKLGDFGYSVLVQKGELINTFYGSIPYLAPEILQNKPFDPFKADIWALGVVLYELYVGEKPWKHHKTVIELIKEITNFKAKFPESFPKEWKVLFEMMLNNDPNKRPTAQEVLALPLFHESGLLSKKYQQSRHIASTANFRELKTYRQEIKEVKSALNIPKMEPININQLKIDN